MFFSEPALSPEVCNEANGLRELLEESLPQRWAVELFHGDHRPPQIGRDAVGVLETPLVIEDIANPRQAGGHAH